jgi:hypothetical protein
LHPILKVIIGVILVLAPIYYIWNEPLRDSYGLNPRRDLVQVIDGIVPVLVIILGLFMIWLELDELRIGRELKTEERRVRRRK